MVSPMVYRLFLHCRAAGSLTRSVLTTARLASREWLLPNPRGIIRGFRAANNYIHQFNVSLTLAGNLTEAQRQKLFEIAKRCPVYKTLTNEIRIVETLEK